jgi:protein disulfide-isomerase
MMNLALVALLVAPAASPGPYDPRADARREIARMLECARDEGKPLLLMFGANWCPWCRDLDRLLTRDPRLAKVVDEGFLRFNVGQYDRNQDLLAAYGIHDLEDTGIPRLVVLRPDGTVRAVKDADDFVSGSRYVKRRIQAFLEAQHTP